MAWVLEIKGYYCDENNNFTAIIPMWSGYSRYYKLRPVNHIKIIGVAVRIEDFGNVDAPWHPDNCYSIKWSEVVLKRCNWKLDKYEQYIIDKCQELTYPSYLKSCKARMWKYYVQATELQKIAGDITYKSKDRENEEAEHYIEAWHNMRSSLTE